MKETHEISAGILVYRLVDSQIQVLLGKVGGPRWANKSVGAWNIPKGHVENDESILNSAIREFIEETSLPLDTADVINKIYLGTSKTSFGKIVHIFAIEKDFLNDPNTYNIEIKSNLCEIEWPENSGKKIKIPELSPEGYYFKLNVAKRLIFPYQKIFLSRLEKELKNKEYVKNE